MERHQKIHPASTSSEGDIPPLQLEKAIQRTLGDTDFLAMMLNQFIEEMPAKIKELREALSQNDHVSIERKAHSLKGAAANLSADRIAALALKLEKLGRENHLDEGETVIANLEEEEENLRVFINQIEW